MPSRTAFLAAAWSSSAFLRPNVIPLYPAQRMIPANSSSVFKSNICGVGHSFKTALEDAPPHQKTPCRSLGISNPVVPGIPEELKQNQVVMRCGLHDYHGSNTAYRLHSPQLGGDPSHTCQVVINFHAAKNVVVGGKDAHIAKMLAYIHTSYRDCLFHVHSPLPWDASSVFARANRRV